VSGAEIYSETMEESPMDGGVYDTQDFLPLFLVLYSTLVDVNQTKTHAAATKTVTTNNHLTL
jgi:hypothetical protein